MLTKSATCMKGGDDMAKKKERHEIMDTAARKRLSKEIGENKLKELEKVIVEEIPPEVTILETPARARLRKEIGKKELERIEACIIRGEI